MQEKATVLYVEDNFANRRLVSRVLTAEGYTILEAESAQEALTVIEEKTPDIILMDINMPEIDGYTLTGKLKDMPKLKNVPIIAMTANVMKGDRERTLDAGCDGYIQKPIDVDTLPQRIATCLRKAQS